MLEPEDPMTAQRLAMRWNGAQNQLFASLMMLEPEDYEALLTLLGEAVAVLRTRAATQTELVAAADGIDEVVAHAAQSARPGPEVQSLLPLLGAAALATRWQELARTEPA